MAPAVFVQSNCDNSVCERTGGAASVERRRREPVTANLAGVARALQQSPLSACAFAAFCTRKLQHMLLCVCLLQHQLGSTSKRLSDASSGIAVRTEMLSKLQSTSAAVGGDVSKFRKTAGTLRVEVDDNSDQPSVLDYLQLKVCSCVGDLGLGYLSFGPIEKILCFVISACAERTGAAAREERSRRER